MGQYDMKRNVIMVMDTLELGGGVEHAALSLLQALPANHYDLTLLLLHKQGDLLRYVPSWVRIEELALTADGRYEYLHGRSALAARLLRQGRLLSVLALLSRGLRIALPTSRTHRAFARFDTLLRKPEGTSLTCDCVLAFCDKLILTWYAAECIQAATKIGWFHTEFPPHVLDRSCYQELYNRYDLWLACSQDLANRLSAQMPSLRVPIKAFPNIMDGESCRTLADKGHGFTDGFTGVRILSVGRLCHQKGFDIAVRVCARLVGMGYKIRWYVIGKGPDADALKAAARDLSVADHFVLLGPASNPYPFFAACDMYVQPSRYEGYCLTVAEARMFNKPIVCTDFAGARDQITDGVTGRIVACAEESILAGVKELLDSSDLRASFSAALSQATVNTRAEVVRLCGWIDASRGER